MSVNKMHECRSIMRAIIRDESIEEKQRRAQFMLQVTSALQMTKATASSYYHIVKTSLVDGKDGYASHKRANKRVTDAKTTTATVQVEDVAPVVTTENVVEVAQVVPAVVDLSNRWQVESKDTNSIVDTFTSRTEAQNAVKSRKSNGENVRWIDAQKRA